jgi:hypothetical protein
MIRNLLNLLIFFVAFTVTVYPQTYTVSGKVIDKTNSKPLQNANVYINNSSKGSITDAQGQYTIGGLRPGKYELVVSYIGFQTLATTIEITNENDEVNFWLDKKEQVLRDVLVVDDATRRKYLKIFKETLLGYTASARRCSIENLEVVSFSSGTGKGDILAFADEDLVVRNPDAGYIIHFQMTDFFFNMEQNASYFFGYMRFEDMSNVGKEGSQYRKWVKRRNEIYYGSSLHFFRSLVNKELDKEGFRLEQRRVTRIDTATEKRKTVTVGSSGMSFKTQAANIMARSMNVTEETLLSLYSDSAYKIYELKLDGALHIIYRRNTKLKNETNQNRQGMFFGGQPSNGTFSGLRLKEVPILIDYRGVILTPMNVIYDGIWIYERMANMLPEDFVPEE